MGMTVEVPVPVPGSPLTDRRMPEYPGVGDALPSTILEKLTGEPTMRAGFSEPFESRIRCDKYK